MGEDKDFLVLRILRKWLGVLLVGSCVERIEGGRRGCQACLDGLGSRDDHLGVASTDHVLEHFKYTM
jgi:hypothetical protein